MEESINPTHAPKQKCACCRIITTATIVGNLGLFWTPIWLARGVKVRYTHKPAKKTTISRTKVARGLSKSLTPNAESCGMILTSYENKSGISERLTTKEKRTSTVNRPFQKKPARARSYYGGHVLGRGRNASELLVQHSQKHACNEA